MELTKKQEEGLNRFRSGEKYMDTTSYCNSCAINNNNYCSYYSIQPSNTSISFCRYYTSSLAKLVNKNLGQI